MDYLNNKVCTNCSFYDKGVCYGLGSVIDDDENITDFEARVDEGKVHEILTELIPEDLLSEELLIEIRESIDDFILEGIKSIRSINEIHIKCPDLFGCKNWR